MVNKRKNRAFTLIELLVVIAIIAMLVAIFSVGMAKIKIHSKNLQQKAAFHAADISLGLFHDDFGDYPDSKYVYDGTSLVTGAQRFAEAMLGRDMQGFNPKTKWHPAKEAAAGLTLYDNSAVDTSAQRKPLYLELKLSGFCRLDQLWGTTPVVEPTPVITDVFAHNRVAGLNEKVGMPVLYFKADPTKRFRVDASRNPVDPIQNSNNTEYSQWIYNFEDNLPLLQLPWLRDPQKWANGLERHYQKEPYPKEPSGADSTLNAQFFYEQLTQRQDGNFFKPYNSDRFILISAGYDGIFGTKDDLTNFDY